MPFPCQLCPFVAQDIRGLTAHVRAHKTTWAEYKKYGAPTPVVKTGTGPEGSAPEKPVALGVIKTTPSPPPAPQRQVASGIEEIGSDEVLWRLRLSP